jgi:hypothetical protein
VSARAAAVNNDTFLASDELRGKAAVARVPARPRRLDGDALNPDAFDELEGVGYHGKLGTTTRRLQRLTITQRSLTKGECGARNVQWVFSLDNAAAEDGYIVQHVQGSEDIVARPGPRSGKMTSTLNFWQAWPIKKGKKVRGRRSSAGPTSASARRRPTPPACR